MEQTAEQTELPHSQPLEAAIIRCLVESESFEMVQIVREVVGEPIHQAFYSRNFKIIAWAVDTLSVESATNAVQVTTWLRSQSFFAALNGIGASFQTGPVEHSNALDAIGGRNAVEDIGGSAIKTSELMRINAETLAHLANSRKAITDLAGIIGRLYRVDPKSGPQAIFTEAIDRLTRMRGPAFIDADGFAALPPDVWDKPTAPRQWLVEGMMPCGGVGFLVSAPGAGKSLVAAELARAIAQGEHFAGKDTLQGATIYLAPDAAESTISRMRAFPDGAKEFIHISRNVTLPDDFASIEAVTKKRSIRLVIVDTYDRSRPHADGGYAAQDALVQSVVGAARAFAFRTGCFVLFVHHSTRAETTRVRGSQSIDGLCDFIGSVVKTNGDKSVTMACQKMRDAPEFEPVTWNKSSVENPDGDSVPVLVASDAQTGKRAAEAIQKQEMEDRVLMAIQWLGKDWSERAIADYLKLGKTTIHRAIERLRTKGEIREQVAEG